jgi:hypothetical protein
MRGISWLAEDLLASQEGLCPIEIVIITKMLHKLNIKTCLHVKGSIRLWMICQFGISIADTSVVIALNVY